MAQIEKPKKPIESNLREKPVIFDQPLMKKIFEAELLCFCSQNTVIRKLELCWSKNDLIRGLTQAVYKVYFQCQEKDRDFSQQLFLVIPGESRMIPGMAEKVELKEGNSSGEGNFNLSHLYLPRLNLLIQAFPTDTRLPQLRALFNNKTIALSLQSYLHMDNTGIHEVTVLKYKPEKRCVMKYNYFSPANKAHSCIGKTFCDNRGEKIFHLIKFLKKVGLPVPKPLSYVPKLKLLLTETLQGRELGAFIGEPIFPIYVKRAARALAALHRAKVDHEFVETVSLKKETVSFARYVKKFQQQCTFMTKEVNHLSSAILSNFMGFRDEYHSFVHGELDPSQFIVNDSNIWFVDFDSFKISNPAVDVGRFLAYINLLSLRHYGDAFRLDVIKEVFLEEYISLCPENPLPQIQVFQAAECLKLSFIQFRRQKINWEYRMSIMWETAEKALTSI